MKRKNSKFKGIILASLLFSMNIPWPQVYAAVPEDAVTQQQVNELPVGDYQFTKKWQVNTWAAILPNNSGQFENFAGQGELYIKVNNIKSFNLYINDYKIPNDEFSEDGLYEIDLSKISKNGKNSLLLLNAEKANEDKSSSIEINIPYPTMKKTNIENQVASEEVMLLLDQLITAETKYGLTGVQVAVVKNGQLVKNTGYGYLNNYRNVFDEDNNSVLDKIEMIPVAERTSVDTNTLFDMASNTKMYATVFALQKLVSEGKVSLKDKISTIFPKFQDDGIGVQAKEEVTVGHLLRHDAGFTPDPQYHNENYLELDFENTGKNPYFSQNRDTTLEMALKTPLQSQPGSKVLYSDVDFILLGFVVEKITGQRLDEYVAENFYNPLGLTRTMFNPLRNGVDSNQITASELHGNSRDGRISFTNNRSEVIQGEVHDEKAYYALDGISGHAGLFSTAEEIANLAQIMLNGGGYGNKEFFSQTTIDEFVTPSPLNDTYSYGWRRQGDQNYASIFSTFASSQTIGHTGWTGTLTLIDPRDNLVIVMNSNSRNSPIMGPGENTFFTTSFLTNGYGAISSLLYQAFNKGDTQKADALIKEMIEQKASFVFEGSQKTASGRNSLRALLEVLQKRAVISQDCADYLSSAKVVSWMNQLAEFEDQDFEFLAFTDEADYSLLDNYIQKADILNEENYTKVSWQKVSAAVEAAWQLKEKTETTQEEIEVATKQIVEALDKLVVNKDEEVVQTVDKEKLQVAVARAKEIDKEKYTEASYQKVSEMLTQAEEILVKKDATQLEVDEAELLLLNAIDQLVEKPVDESLNLSVQSLEILKKGKKLTVTVKGIDSSEIEWEVQNTAIASVDKTGVVTAKKAGTTKITAKASNGKTASFTLRVSN